MNTRFSVPNEIAVRIRDWKTLDKPIRALLEIGFHPLSSLRLAAPIRTAEATIIQPATASTADHPATKLGTCGKSVKQAIPSPMAASAGNATPISLPRCSSKFHPMAARAVNPIHSVDKSATGTNQPRSANPALKGNLAACSNIARNPRIGPVKMPNRWLYGALGMFKTTGCFH